MQKNRKLLYHGSDEWHACACVDLEANTVDSVLCDQSFLPLLRLLIFYGHVVGLKRLNLMRNKQVEFCVHNATTTTRSRSLMGLQQQQGSLPDKRTRRRVHHE